MPRCKPVRYSRKLPEQNISTTQLDLESWNLRFDRGNRRDSPLQMTTMQYSVPGMR